MQTVDLRLGDCVDLARNYQGDLFHALLCDSPYEMGFMGKGWDKSGVAFDPDTWRALASPLHPGAFLIVMAGTVNDDLISVAMRKAGLRKHHKIMGWVYGSGFPKASRIDTQVDKEAGAKREVIGLAADFSLDGCDRKIDGSHARPTQQVPSGDRWSQEVTAPATDLARTGAGHRYGLQALKPAIETILIFQKPYEGKPVGCITRTGAGALWIDGARIETNWGQDPTRRGWQGGNSKEGYASIVTIVPGDGKRRVSFPNHCGRWPSNFILEHHPDCKRIGARRVKNNGGIPQAHDVKDSPIKLLGKERTGFTHYFDEDGYETIEAWECVPECPVRRLDEQSGISKSCGGQSSLGAFRNGNIYGAGRDEKRKSDPGKGDVGGASRFFLRVQDQIDVADPVYYCAKAGRRERDAGLGDMPISEPEHNTSTNYCDRCGNRVNPNGSGIKCECGDDRITRHKTTARNSHPTVKPIALTRYLAALLLPPAIYAPRRLFVPFAGVASEMIGAIQAGWEEIVGIELQPDYCEIGRTRIEHWHAKMETRAQMPLLELVGRA